MSDPWAFSDVLLLALPRQSEIASGRTGKESKGERGGGGGRQEADDGVSPHHLFNLKSLFLAQSHFFFVCLSCALLGVL